MLAACKSRATGGIMPPNLYLILLAITVNEEYDVTYFKCVRNCE